MPVAEFFREGLRDAYEVALAIVFVDEFGVLRK